VAALLQAILGLLRETLEGRGEKQDTSGAGEEEDDTFGPSDPDSEEEDIEDAEEDEEGREPWEP